MREYMYGPITNTFKELNQLLLHQQEWNAQMQAREQEFALQSQMQEQQVKDQMQQRQIRQYQLNELEEAEKFVPVRASMFGYGSGDFSESLFNRNQDNIRKFASSDPAARWDFDNDQLLDSKGNPVMVKNKNLPVLLASGNFSSIANYDPEEHRLYKLAQIDEQLAQVPKRAGMTGPYSSLMSQGDKDITGAKAAMMRKMLNAQRKQWETPLQGDESRLMMVGQMNMLKKAYPRLLLATDNPNLVRQLYNDAWTMYSKQLEDYDKQIKGEKVSVFNAEAGIKREVSPKQAAVLVESGQFEYGEPYGEQSNKRWIYREVRTSDGKMTTIKAQVAAGKELDKKLKDGWKEGVPMGGGDGQAKSIQERSLAVWNQTAAGRRPDGTPRSIEEYDRYKRGMETSDADLIEQIATLRDELPQQLIDALEGVDAEGNQIRPPVSNMQILAQAKQAQRVMEQAGAPLTTPDIVTLMAELLMQGHTQILSGDFSVMLQLWNEEVAAAQANVPDKIIQQHYEDMYYPEEQQSRRAPAAQPTQPKRTGGGGVKSKHGVKF